MSSPPKTIWGPDDKLLRISGGPFSKEQVREILELLDDDPLGMRATSGPWLRNNLYFMCVSHELLRKENESTELLKKIMKILGPYPEMTDTQAAKAAGKVAALLFKEQGTREAA